MWSFGNCFENMKLYVEKHNVILCVRCAAGSEAGSRCGPVARNGPGDPLAQYMNGLETKASLRRKWWWYDIINAAMYYSRAAVRGFLILSFCLFFLLPSPPLLFSAVSLRCLLYFYNLLYLRVLSWASPLWWLLYLYGRLYLRPLILSAHPPLPNGRYIIRSGFPELSQFGFTFIIYIHTYIHTYVYYILDKKLAYFLGK